MGAPAAARCRWVMCLNILTRSATPPICPQDIFGGSGEIERDDLQSLPEMPDLMNRVLGFACRIDQQASREVGGDGVGEQLIDVGMSHTAMIDSLVFDVTDE